MMIKRHIIAMLIFMNLGIQTVPCFSQTSDSNAKRLDRDLRIMEGILDKLIMGKESHRFINKGTQAVYLPDYGVVFHTSHSPEMQRVDIRILEATKRLEKISEKIDRKHRAIRERIQVEEKAMAEEEQSQEYEVFNLTPELIIEKEKKSIESFKTGIRTFYQNYASAIGQLNPDHRIAVLINLDDWESVDSESAFLTSWVDKQTIDEYRNKKIRADEFNDLIHFQLGSQESDIDFDIGIFTEIFNRALDGTTYMTGSTNKGLYLDGLGVILFMRMPALYFIGSSGDPVSIIVNSSVSNAIAYSLGHQTRDVHGEQSIDWEDRLQTTETEIFDLLASYGHTLRLKPRDRIILNVDMGSGLIHHGRDHNEPSRLLLELNKKDVDAYNDGRVSIKELRKRLVKQTY